jgi:hypothetical protein
MRLLLGLKRLATKTLVALPVLGGIVLLMTVATGPVATIVVTLALLVYLLAWDRVDAPEGRWQGHLARFAIPALIAGTALLLAVVVAVGVTVREPTVALLLAVLGMICAVGAVALAISPTRRS